MGVLYLVSTPIGNLEDVTLRALRVLREADLVLAEDTRRARKLLDRHGIAARPVSLHAHNEAARVDRVLEALAAGRAVALVSDAGTPLVSDPGERLVRAAASAGHEVRAVPGPSAVLAALAVSGLPAGRFRFLGFVPRRAGELASLLDRVAAEPDTLIWFESPRRLGATLRALALRLGPRRACVARELTKLHEEAARGSLAELAERFSAGARGEITLVVDGASQIPAPANVEDLDPEIRRLLSAGASCREIAAELAETGVPRRAVYARAVALRGGRST
jgi:16S rRNA (cytidine1402-2'-O)-methyltransferase